MNEQEAVAYLTPHHLTSDTASVVLTAGKMREAMATLHHVVATKADRIAALEALVRELAGTLQTVVDYPERDTMDVGFVHGRYTRQELEACISSMRNEAAYALSHPLVSELIGMKEGRSNV